MALTAERKRAIQIAMRKAYLLYRDDKDSKKVGLASNYILEAMDPLHRDKAELNDRLNNGD